jgi:hypothetical protein
MKNFRFIAIMLSLSMFISSCGMFNKLFGPKYGCPTNGKNIDAGKLATGDPEAEKAAKKAKKFKS